MTKTKPKIMIVDYHKDTVLSFRALLEQHGYRVDTFTDPKEALNNFSPKRYDIVIADTKMPGLTGFELARRIDKIDKDTKIVLMTAFEITKEELEKVFPSIRVDAFIRKPIGIVKLMDHLHVLLGIHSHKGRRDSKVLHQ